MAWWTKHSVALVQTAAGVGTHDGFLLLVFGKPSPDHPITHIASASYVGIDCLSIKLHLQQASELLSSAEPLSEHLYQRATQNPVGPLSKLWNE